MNSSLQFDSAPRKELKLSRQLEILTMPPRQRRQLLRKIAQGTRKNMRQNIRQQRTIDGKKMTPRADRRKARMFRRMAKNSIVRIVNDYRATVGWKHAGQAKTAYRHHFGIDEDFTAKKAAKRYGVPDYKRPATAAQAKALNREGYRRPVARKNGKGKAVLRKVSQRWIRENMTVGQAGLILRIMRGEQKGKQSWRIKVPERPILGASEKDADKFLTAMAAEALQNIKRA